MAGRCEKCGKWAYSSYREAIRRALGSSRHYGAGFRIYKVHGSFHLTSQPPRTEREAS